MFVCVIFVYNCVYRNKGVQLFKECYAILTLSEDEE